MSSGPRLSVGVLTADLLGLGGELDILRGGADVVVSGSARHDGTGPAGHLDRMLTRLGMTPASTSIS